MVFIIQSPLGSTWEAHHTWQGGLNIMNKGPWTELGPVPGGTLISGHKNMEGGSYGSLDKELSDLKDDDNLEQPRVME
jgi:hypothetical protein